MSEGLDVVVLGGGTGGYVAAIRGAQLGLRVALVESGQVGGTCLHRGCIPSKALLRSAELFASAKEGGAFGVVVDGLRFDLTAAMERKTRIVDQLESGVRHLLKKNGVEVITGFGRVMGASIFSPTAGAVRVERADGETPVLTPRHTIIATGSKPRELPGLPFDGVRVLSSDHILALDALPASLTVVGGGAIGVEQASLFADLGVEVTLIEALPRLLPAEDLDVSAEMARVLKKRGVKVHVNAAIDVSNAKVDGAGVCLPLNTAGGEVRVCADVVLIAIGRDPCTDGIGLEATRVRLSRGMVVVDDRMRTAESAIYAIGDVAGPLQLAHAAARQGIVAMEDIAGEDPDPVAYDDIPRCTYSRPEAASVGWTEQQARERRTQVKVGKFSFRAIGKALVQGEADGFAKVVADGLTGDVLGVHIIGPHATDLIGEAALARLLDATPWELGRLTHAHPTLSEVLGEAALAVDGLAIHS